MGERKRVNIRTNCQIHHHYLYVYATVHCPKNQYEVVFCKKLIIRIYQRRNAQSQPVSRDSPEDHRQSYSARCYEHRDPYCATKQELLDIRLANMKSTEGGRFGLAKEDENWVKLVLMRDEEKDGECEGNEELVRVTSISQRGKSANGPGTHEETL